MGVSPRLRATKARGPEIGARRLAAEEVPGLPAAIAEAHRRLAGRGGFPIRAIGHPSSATGRTTPGRC